MATIKKTTSKKKVITDQLIINAYMEYVLDHEKQPISIYKFCKEIKITEVDFYNHFGSFDNLKTNIWNTFHQKTIKILESSKEYTTYSNKDKMLSYFFTLFELFTANRSYILFSLEEQKHILKNLKPLKELRIHLKEFAGNVVLTSNEDKTYKIIKNPEHIFGESVWVQFLFLLKYWLDDTSTGFEKTDIAIEKSVKAIFDVFETTPLESIIDFGKFIVKEKLKPNL